MTTGYISIGSNIDKEIHIPSSLVALRKQFDNIRISSIYESEAVGFVGPGFHNLIVEFTSALSAKELAKILRQIELDHGRLRDAPKFSPRTLDLDLILFGEQVISDGRLRIPRDEIERYAFVLEPLAEIAPDALHPISHLSYRQLWDQFDKRELRQHRVIPVWLLNEQTPTTVNSQNVAGDIIGIAH